MSYKYPTSDDFSYVPVKYKYVKTETDIYHMYKKSVKKPVPKLKYLEVLGVFFLEFIKYLVYNKRASVPYIGDFYLHYVCRRWGKPLIDLRKVFSDDRSDPTIHFTNKYPKLKWDSKNYRFRNVTFYMMKTTKLLRSKLFTTYIDQ